ncbi:hypothetical protein F5Y10DRAFT_290797 [Nemania abortiva]|nr:hypothetical protein F5Y10DRAFT_290797 [Nemania abortiva]
MWAEIDPDDSEDDSNWPVLEYEPGEEGANMMNCVAIYRSEEACSHLDTVVTIAFFLLLHLQDIQKYQLNDVDAWIDWMRGSLPDASTRKGFTVLLCPKTRPSTGNYPWGELPTQLRTIPLTPVVLDYVASGFEIPFRSFRLLQEQRTYMSTLDLEATLPSTHSASFTSDITNYPENIAFVHTYSPEHQSSCGIFFGCSQDDIEAVFSMLKKSGSAYTHPLLLPAVFAELQTSHLQELSEGMMDEAVLVAAQMERLSSGGKRFQATDLANKASDINMDAKVLEEDIAKAHRQLKSLIKCIHRYGNATYLDRYDIHGRMTSVFLRRFERMSLQYDDLSGSCRVMMGMAVFSSDIHATGISRYAVTASIPAIVAMIYLPFSTLASIFSIPIFDFKANWRDIHGHSVPVPPGSGDSHPITVSYYLVHYLGVSSALLLFTLEAWHVFTREDDVEWQRFWKYFLTTRLLIRLHWVTWNALKRFWNTLKRFWNVLKRFWNVLKPFWNILKRFWDVLKRFWDVLKRFWNALKRSWEALKPFWNILKRFCEALVYSLEALWHVWEVLTYIRRRRFMVRLWMMRNERRRTGDEIPLTVTTV